MKFTENIKKCTFNNKNCMKKIFYKKPAIPVLACIILLLLISGLGKSFSQYIEENDIEKEDTKEVKRILEKESQKEGTLPAYIAYNIKAIKVPYLNDAIRISWNINPNYDDQFIIGRSNEIIDTKERALSALSVTVINSKSKNIYIDEGLKPGTYYYVILAKDKIYKRDIELYRDINYTSLPVIIDVPEVKSNHVMNIFAKSVGGKKILVTWEHLSLPGNVYYVYRSNSVIDSENNLRRAKRVGVVVNNDEYLDEDIEDTDREYYYAVTLKDSRGIENPDLVPDQNYTTKAVVFKKTVTASITDISATLIDLRDIKIKWKLTGESGDPDIIGFELYRSGEMINRPDKIDSAIHIKSLDKSVQYYIDKVDFTGEFFYAVLLKRKGGIINVTLERGENYTDEPVIVANTFKIVSIHAEPEGSNIIVKWNYSGITEDKLYKIYRTVRNISSVNNLKEKNFLATVDITDKSYTDVNVPVGKYFYGIVPLKKTKGYRVLKGINIISEPVTISMRKNAEYVEKYSGDREYREETRDIDLIIKRTFFSGYFREAIKELKKAVKNSDNKRDIAKAKLFLGRSYIEIGQYRRALKYLIMRDARKYFPDETKFWRDFAMLRVNRR